MTPRALVQAALRHEVTARIPRQLWCLPWARRVYPDAVAEIERDFPDDLIQPDYRSPPSDRRRGDPHTEGIYVDEWGCVFENLCPGVIGEVKHPILQSYTELDRVRPPDELVGKGLEHVNTSCAGTDRFVVFNWCSLFERMQFLRGSEDLLMDLAYLPAGVYKLRDRVHEFNVRALEPWLATDVDALAFSDDWGTQLALLVNPKLWRELFKPCYREYAEAIHRAGKFAFMHSDGHIFDIYEDLIEIGIDAINSQLFCMDIEDVAKRFKRRITFWGEIDRQHLLAFATVDEVREAVRRVARAFYDGHGGVVAQCEFSAGSRPENVRAVFETWDQISRDRAT